MMDGDAMNSIITALRSVQPVMADDTKPGTPTHGFVALPEGYALADVVPFLPPPPWIRQEVELTHPDSFCEYVLRFKSEVSVVFADETAGQFAAVLDYHAAPAEDVIGKIPSPRGRDEHVARYKCPLTDNWTQWMEADQKAFTQVQLARFIERNLLDIFQPKGADMMQLALSLEVHKTAKFESEIRLGNGQRQFRYSEEVRGATKAGDITIPDLFVLKLPIFLDGPLHEILARFRYSLRDGVLTLSYELVNPQEAFRQAAKQVTGIIKAGLPGVPLWLGSRGG